MYCFCTARLPIRAIPAISADASDPLRDPLLPLLFQYLWQSHDGFAQVAGAGGMVRILPEEQVEFT
jgi:hypothetical protein